MIAILRVGYDEPQSRSRYWVGSYSGRETGSWSVSRFLSRSGSGSRSRSRARVRSWSGSRSRVRSNSRSWSKKIRV